MPEVKVYSTPTCPWCSRVKQFLDERNIPYEEYNVAEDMARAQEMVQKSGQMGVPVIEVDGEIVIGFDRPRLEELLGLAE
ncbi:MAG: glutathione S-transferase N-terminal domain-containing protein [Candidatus Acetothermia bacterium]|jgi:glutaredoxin-like YruB-family protein|nr:glutathione S-transferase N-terminal domain-containing protein [Candidatus Acetothermia bacterium]MDH7506134.1 glutaredoxin domain-containing protein [Candidatus Acetothermia bacterium]